MVNQPAKYSVSADGNLVLGSQFDEFIGVIPFADSGIDVLPPDGAPINDSEHAGANTDNFVGIGDFFATLDSAAASADAHSINQQDDSVIPSTSDSADVPGTSDNFIADTYTGSGGSLNNYHFSSILDHIDNLSFDHIDNLINGATDSSVSGGFSPPSGLSFETPAASPIGVPDFFSEAKGGSHGGGGGGGSSTTPAPYTTHSGTGVEIHITYDSSVDNAPAGFTSVIQQVADFFAGSLQDSTPITINIDVGYGEVDGIRMGRGALGASVTNLQDVSYSDLAAAYSPSGLSLGGSIPVGNLYVSYAEAKALGIAITDPQTVDGYVGFSSQSGIFDFNNADGISSRHYDFYGTVAHEFSEVMGRILLVGGIINNAPSYMAYDFFHFSNPGVQDFSGNGGYFSIDQGATNLASFNNPSNGGDAGDWANSGTSGSGGSIYDAFNAFGTPGEVTPISATDLLALQAIGYDLQHLLMA